MTRILLINAHSARNAGDEALTRVTIAQLAQNFPAAKFTLLMDEPQRAAGEQGQMMGSLYAWLRRQGAAGLRSWRLLNLLLMLPATLVPLISHRIAGRALFGLTPRPLRPILEAFVQADLVVAVAGGFLYSSGSGLTLALKAYSLGLALLASKPLYTFPVSIGPLQRRWECALLRLVLARARLLLVREPESLALLENCRVSNPNTYMLPDPAFSYVESDPDKVAAWARSLGLEEGNGVPKLGLTVIDWGAQNPGFGRQGVYEQSVAQAVRYFVERIGGRAIIFCQVTGPSPSQDDRVPARRIAASLESLGKSVILWEEPTPPDLLRGMYGLMDIFLGTRMHGNIFALSQGVPALAVAYQPKTLGILKMLALEEWSLDIGQVDGARLTARLADLWESREQVRAHLAERLPEIVEKASLAGPLVAQDYALLKPA